MGTTRAETGDDGTAVDVSATALTRVTARVAESGLADRVDVQQHDLTASLPDGTFDLVLAQFLQSPLEFDRNPVLRKLARSIAPGGLLLVVDHASAPCWPWERHPDAHFPHPAQALAALELDPARWTTEVVETRQREATGLAGESAMLREGVVAVRRRTD